MSNLKGKVFEERFLLEKRTGAERRSFLNAYSCYQMVGIHVLYYTFDLSEEEIIDITAKFQEYDQQEGLEQQWEIEILQKYHILARQEAVNFPLLQKRSLAVIPRKMHDKYEQQNLMAQTEVALYCYYIVMIKTLENSESFKNAVNGDLKAGLEKFIEDFREVCKLFKKGMTKQWLEDFLVKEHGFDIIKVDVESIPLYVEANKGEDIS